MNNNCIKIESSVKEYVPSIMPVQQYLNALFSNNHSEQPTTMNTPATASSSQTKVPPPTPRAVFQHKDLNYIYASPGVTATVSFGHYTPHSSSPLKAPSASSHSKSASMPSLPTSAPPGSGRTFRQRVSSLSIPTSILQNPLATQSTRLPSFSLATINPDQTLLRTA